jgi:hypothetical protein
VIPEDVEFYTHRHALRGDVNGIYGEPLAGGPVGAETLVTKNYTVTVSQSFDETRMTVLAFLFRDDTKEIIQVNESKVLD